MLKLSPTIEEQEMLIKKPILFNLDKGLDLKQVYQLYLRVGNLDAFHIQAFEDMMDTKVLNITSLLCKFIQKTFCLTQFNKGCSHKQSTQIMILRMGPEARRGILHPIACSTLNLYIPYSL